MSKNALRGEGQNIVRRQKWKGKNAFNNLGDSRELMRVEDSFERGWGPGPCCHLSTAFASLKTYPISS
jgi:hypothetical protein